MEALKRIAAEAAVAEIADGMLVGLGTGSTAAFAIAALGRRVEEGLKVTAVSTSLQTAQAAEKAGIRVLDFADVAATDLCIDGVDEIDPHLRAIKGGGGAMLREKVVATASSRMIAIADGSKSVSQLGTRPVPIEYLPFARAFVARRVQELGGNAAARLTEAGSVFLTDQGNPILDCSFGPIVDPDALALSLSTIPGVLGHGLFVDQIHTLYLATAAGLKRCDWRF
ncbi:ribose-5-phosphate isomerase RpiA [Sphingomonas xinjiangensis]|uniref:Ribose-5-phosphate isomerase A n=1 Tax=Sphingomonas xinjiangensis TaxID=643568 RepID=A0A840YEL4_9SPHN|nr:ribose-5-phosphate isomerase RpiA [Sphingomonas xinjiangensis]MBB5709218.1 ribose 5-phosphate isomerase A [Sphingomonas xinjiangensis]